MCSWKSCSAKLKSANIAEIANNAEIYKSMYMYRNVKYKREHKNIKRI